MSKKPWERWEENVNEALGLDGTVASGATWKDKGDGTTRGENAWPLLVDAKATEAASYSLKHKVLNDLWKTAMLAGRTFALPVRFVGQEGETDWVVIPFGDYEVLVDHYRTTSDGFTEEERALMRAIAGQLKGETLRGKALHILKKMGGIP